MAKRKKEDLENDYENVDNLKLIDNLKGLRGENRIPHLEAILKKLSYYEKGGDNSLSMLHMDAFIVKAVQLYFVKKKGNIKKRDVVLMAFGLLKGCEYQKITSHRSRQEWFLRKTSDLEDNPRESVKVYDLTDGKNQDRLCANLEKRESDYIEELKKYLEKVKKDAGDIVSYVTEIDDYVVKNKGEIAFVILPELPNLKRESSTKLIIREYGLKILNELEVIKKGNFVIRFSCIAIVLMVGVSPATPLMQKIIVRYKESIAPERQTVSVNTNNLQDEMRGDRNNEFPQLFTVSESERNDGEASSISDNNFVDTRNARR